MLILMADSADSYKKIQTYLGNVSGGENPRITGDVAGCESSAFCGEGAFVLASVKDARRRFAVAFGHP